MNNIKELLSNIGDWINVILILFSIAITLVSIIFKVKSNFIAQITLFIKEAEAETELTGPEKMDMVISWIQNLIPRLFKVIFSDNILRGIANNIYADMKAYREVYINNKTGLDTAQVIQIVKQTSVEEVKEE